MCKNIISVKICTVLQVIVDMPEICVLLMYSLFLMSTLDLSHLPGCTEQMTLHFNRADLAACEELQEWMEQVPKMLWCKGVYTDETNAA